MIPYDVPVTQPGSAVHQNTSSGCRSSAYRPVAKCVTAAAWTCSAPLGVPVVPLVKCSSAASSAAVGSNAKSSEAAASSAPKSRVPGTSVARPPSPTSSTCRSCGSASRRPATLRRYSASVVTSTLPAPRARRVRIGSGPNAEKRGDTTVAFLSAPSAAT